MAAYGCEIAVNVCENGNAGDKERRRNRIKTIVDAGLQNIAGRDKKSAGAKTGKNRLANEEATNNQ